MNLGVLICVISGLLSFGLILRGLRALRAGDVERGAGAGGGSKWGVALDAWSILTVLLGIGLIVRVYRRVTAPTKPPIPEGWVATEDDLARLRSLNISGFDVTSVEQLNHELQNGARIRRYPFVVGLGIFMFPLRSRLYYCRHHNDYAKTIPYTLLSLVMGLSGLTGPFGFGVALKSLASSFSGGSDSTYDMLEGLHSPRGLRIDPRSNWPLFWACVWWNGALYGLIFAALTYKALLHPRIGNEPFDIRVEGVRYFALLFGVSFLVFVLAAAVPLALNLLERRSFVSFVGARHIRATKSGFLTVISLLSIAGVHMSSGALCSVTSIMGGFGHDLKRKILNNNAHLVIDTTRTGGINDWEDTLVDVRKELTPRGGKATPVVAGDAMGSSNSNTAGVLVRGIDAGSIGDVIDLRENIKDENGGVGDWSYFLQPDKLIDLPADTIIGRAPDGQRVLKAPESRYSDPLVAPEVREILKNPLPVRPSIILGRELAKSLHVYIGDEISLLSPMGELGPMGIMPRTRKFRVAAIFYSGMYEYDASHAYIDLKVAQEFFSMENKISQIDVRVPEPEKVGESRPAVDAALTAAMNRERPENAAPLAPLRARDWMEMNKNLFSALKLERVATFVILSIAIAVASFCIICTLLLMVTEKGKQIAIMKALGASDGAIMRIFMLEGIIIGAIGTTSGVMTALATSTGLKWFGVRLDPEVYYIDRLPVNVDLKDYALVALASMVICTLSTIYPALAASKLEPVEGLRHE